MFTLPEILPIALVRLLWSPLIRNLFRLTSFCFNMQIPMGLVISVARAKPRKISRGLFCMPHVLRLPLVPQTIG